MYIKSFLAAVIDSCYPVQSAVWFFPALIYILEHLRYRLQQGFYSGGRYFLFALSQTARSKGCLSSIGHGGVYEQTITEQFRWACVMARVQGILASSAKYGFGHSCKITVDEDVLPNRRSNYERRRRISQRRSSVELKRTRKVQPPNITSSEFISEQRNDERRSTHYKSA